MTNREKHEIAVAVRAVINDEDKEIINLYKKVYGSEIGFRKYVRQQCITFWTDFDVYLDKKYLDYCWIQVGNRIINYDDLWVFIKDCLKDDEKRNN